MRLLATFILPITLGLGSLMTSGADARPLSDAQKIKRIEELYRSYAKELKGAPEVTVKQLLAWLKRGKKLVLVDVREPKEQRVSMLPGAIPAQRFSKQVEKHAANGVTVVAYCTIGYRSGQLVKKLRREHPKIPAFNLRGGILSWAHAGQPLEKDGKPTRRLHVYGATWDLAPKGIETTW